MEIPYYPGCTLKIKAMALDQSTVAAFGALGVSLKELPRWTCCGAVYPLTAKKIAGLAAPIRILREAKMMGSDTVVTACAFCYNVLKRANKDFAADPLRKKRINAYLADDVRVDEATGEKIREWPEYAGAEDVKVLHLLELLRDRIGFQKIPVRKPLGGLRVAPYYGCQLVRPRKDHQDVEQPQFFEELLSALGAAPIRCITKLRCCGASLIVTNRKAALAMVHTLLQDAVDHRAEVIATVCPLCQINLECYQNQANREFGTKLSVPVLYFTQLMGLALGIPPKRLGFGREIVSIPRTLLHGEKKEVAAHAR